MTYKQVANLTGLSVSHVRGVLRGQRKPSAKTLVLLAAQLGVGADFLSKRISGKNQRRISKRII